MQLVPLKRSPMSSQWRFVGTTQNGVQIWASRNGVRYAKDSAGRWYKIAKD